MDLGKALENLLGDNKPLRCGMCKGKMIYINKGVYKCNDCGYEAMDDFGKVNQFLKENGPMPAHIIAVATGVSAKTIDAFFREGRIEVAEGSPYFINCERCCKPIRSGRYCDACVNELAGDIKQRFEQDTLKSPNKYGKSGKMRFLKNRETK